MKTQQVNIGSKADPKFTNIGDYWDEDTIDNVAELLCEYQDLFLMNFSYLKGIIRVLSIMKIILKPNVKAIKQRPYRLNPKSKEKVCQELDKMLDVGIIELIKELDWVSPMVV